MKWILVLLLGVLCIAVCMTVLFWNDGKSTAIGWIAFTGTIPSCLIASLGLSMWCERGPNRIGDGT